MAGLNLLTPSGGIVNISPTNTATNVTLNLPTSNGSLVSANTGSGTFTTSNFNSASSFGFKNRIINGGMVIDQRNAGASGTAAGYTVDRWQYEPSQSSKGTWQQNYNSVTPPVGFSNYLGFVSSSSYSVLAGDYFNFSQYIEGYNISDLAWGTANAKTVTLSFQVYSSLTGTFGGALRNNGATRSYPFSYTISSANTWTAVSITIAGDTSGTWLTNNGRGIYLAFGLGVGSTYSGTAGSWAGTNYISATGATSVVGTNGATFYITGVQFEVGSVATPFDFRSYGQELALCQRYYIKYDANDSNGGYASFFSAMNSSATAILITPFFPVPLRAPNPTQTWGGNIRLLYPGGATAAITGLSASNSQITTKGGYAAFNVNNTGYSSQGPVYPGGANDTNAYWAFSAEL